ncbi:MAG: DUF6537 domain-containing protein [Verrucomicrobiota bacterium]
MNKKKVDPRFLKEEGHEIFTGNELLVKGLLETEGGTHLWTGYPGSPVAGFFDTIQALQEIPRQYGIQATMAANEALSVAMVNGSQMHGLRAITAMKSVGVHVASDALAIGNLAGAHPQGGAVVVLGDDPWSDSTQVPSDSRFLCKHLHMPVLEPSDPQELKDWIDLAFKLSRESELYIGYLVTTNQADGGGTVEVRHNHYPRENTQSRFALDSSQVNFEQKVLLPPRTWRQEQALPGRFERLWASARRHGVNRVVNPRDPKHARAPLGFVTSALAFSYLEHALGELDLSDIFPILKLGVTYPLDPELIQDFADQCEHLVVVEERRGFLEEQVATLLAARDTRRPAVTLYGKNFPDGLEGFPSTRGLNPSLVMSILAPLLQRFLPEDDPTSWSQWFHQLIGDDRPKLKPASLKRELDLLDEVASFEVDLAPRTPTFCPGCPHRDSASVLVEIKKSFMDADYMQRHHRREPVDLIFHGDTGCYTMLMFEPTKDLMHNYSGMGLGGATGLGIDPFITNKQVVFMGDGTFFHSGQVAISNSIKNSQDITYVILDNKTTAMTGHQPTSGIEPDLMGNSTFVQRIDRIIEGMREHDNVMVVRANPEQREGYQKLLEETILKDGVKVIIADKECGITYNRTKNRARRAEAKEKGFVREWKHINITPEVCENCLECTIATGCPGLTFIETDFGRKVQTDLSWCVADNACTKIHACPSFEEVTVVRSRKPASRMPELKQEFPEPPKPSFDGNGKFHIYLAGVGGMGIATSTATLVRAAHREGYEVGFCDKNGLAIRNGGVYSQITYRQPGVNHTSPLIPYGKADLILGVDPLEAARGLDPEGNVRIACPARTAAVINRTKTPTILTLLGRDDFCLDQLEDILKRYTRPGAFFSVDVSEISERVFGTKLYANIIMLGVAYQSGHLPLSQDSLQWAIHETMGAAANDNWQAFKLGRWLRLEPQHAHAANGKADDYHAVVVEKSTLLQSNPGGRQGQRAAQDYWGLVAGAMSRLALPAADEALLAGRIYDLMRYGGRDCAADYVERLAAIHARDSAARGYEITRAALWNLHRVTAIKDEIYVAGLLTSEEKYARDRERYNVRPELGDKMVYRHLNRPEFVLGGKKIRFKIRSQPWMLKAMAKQKWLRRALPGWHRQEQDFRDWYYRLVETFPGADLLSEEDYRRWVEILRLPETARGYREVRYPKMNAAREQAEKMLRQMGRAVLAGQA